MPQIKSKKAKEYVAKFWYEQPNKQALQMAYMAGFTEAEECHANELQAVKDKALKAFRFAIDLPKESDTYKLLEKLFTQKLNEQ